MSIEILQHVVPLSIFGKECCKLGPKSAFGRPGCVAPKAAA